MITRKAFLRQVGLAGAGVGLAGLSPLTTYAGSSWSTVITIMHTNDTHARINPIPDGAGEYPGLGGIARRAALVKKIRARNPRNLLLDAGDIFQGTPYFNFYGGALDLELMSMMGYDASTIGNHEFDNKVEGFVNVAPKAQFPFVNSNYDFSGAPEMGAFIDPYLVRVVDGIRIGIFGLGVAFEELVLPDLHKGVTPIDPFATSDRFARMLRQEHACDMVICLSHLGYEQDERIDIGDVDIAEQVNGIDLIIGGHSHTLLEEPHVLEKPGQRPTIISQVGHAGVVLGQLDLEFDRNKKITKVSTANQWIDASV